MVSEKSLGTGIGKIWYRKKYRYRYRSTFWVPSHTVAFSLIFAIFIISNFLQVKSSKIFQFLSFLLKSSPILLGISGIFTKIIIFSLFLHKVPDHYFLINLFILFVLFVLLDKRGRWCTRHGCFLFKSIFTMVFVLLDKRGRCTRPFSF